MFFGGWRKKKVKELRKNQGLTAKELAERIKCETIEILEIDELELRNVPEPLQSRITPVLNGDETDKIPWL